MENTKLTSTVTVTVKKYRDFKSTKNCDKIADLLYERFSERYIEPFKNNPAKHGFSLMAVSCLMVESLYCFQKGRKKTGEAGGDAFEKFFSSSQSLIVFSGVGKEFYKNVRCGILHQGETYGGWKILRKGELFNKRTKTINATKFIKAMEKELLNFTEILRETRFHRKPMSGVIRKLDHICKNCNA